LERALRAGERPCRPQQFGRLPTLAQPSLESFIPKFDAFKMLQSICIDDAARCGVDADLLTRVDGQYVASDGERCV